MSSIDFILSKIDNKFFNYIISNTLSVKYLIFEKFMLKFKRLTYVAKKDDPKVTIYIPTYNRSSILLSKAIPSVLKQKFRDYELLIIGDRCTDDTELEIKKLNNNKIKFFNISYKFKPMPLTKENLWMAGEVKAANFALKKAKGEWIARLDDDEEWMNENHLNEMLEFAETNKFEMISASNEVLIDGKIKIDKGQKLVSKYFDNLNTKTNYKNTNIGGHSTWLYKSYLKFIKYNNQCWRKKINRVNDLDLITRFLSAGVRIGFYDKPMTRITQTNRKI